MARYKRRTFARARQGYSMASSSSFSNPHLMGPPYFAALFCLIFRRASRLGVCTSLTKTANFFLIWALKWCGDPPSPISPFFPETKCFKFSSVNAPLTPPKKPRRIKHKASKDDKNRPSPGGGVWRRPRIKLANRMLIGFLRKSDSLGLFLQPQRLERITS